MEKGLIIPVVVMSSFLMGWTAWAAPNLEVRLSKHNLAPEEVTALTIQIDWPQEEANYQFTLPHLQLKNLTLLRQGESQETFRQKGVNTARKTYVYEFKGDLEGEAQIEPFLLTYRDEKSELIGEFHIEGQKVNIRSAQGPRSMVSYTAGSAAILILAALFFLNRRRKSRAIREPPEVLSREEEAIRTIRNISEQTQVANIQDSVRQLSSRFSRFLEAYYALQGAASTEKDLLEKLKTKDIDSKDYARLQSILQELYEAKYAGTAHTVTDFNLLTDNVIRYIEGKRILGSSGTPR